MKYIYPDYYDKFKCVASDCPCTCCAGWAIEINENSLERYRQLGIVTVDYEEGIFLQDGTSQKRCLNLDNNGLCRLILAHGEDILCDTCRLFPRHIEEFEGVREYSLSISCPQVAKMLLSKEDAVTWRVKEDDTKDAEEYEDYEQEVYRSLAPLRDEILDILQQQRGKSLAARCLKVLSMVSDFQDAQDGVLTEACDVVSLQDTFDAMLEWEYTSEEFPEIVRRAREILFEGEDALCECLTLAYLDRETAGVTAMQLQQVIVYFLYSYLCGSVYDEYYYGMAQLCVCAAIHIKLLVEAHIRLYGEVTAEDTERYTYLYARELEHSIPNVLGMEAWMDENRIME